MKALIIGEVLQGILLGIYSTEPQRSRAMDILLAARNYYETGVEPNTDGTLLHADTWSIIKRECDKFIEADEAYHNAKAEAGRKGGLAKASNAKQNLAKPSTATNSLANSSKSKQSLANVALEIEENKNNKYNTEKENDKEKELSVGVGDINLSSSVSVHYASDPALYAMKLVDRNNKRDYQTFSSLLRKLGIHTFCEIVNEFDSQKRQGEMNSVKNLAAVLVSKLKKQSTI